MAVQQFILTTDGTTVTVAKALRPIDTVIIDPMTTDPSTVPDNQTPVSVFITNSVMGPLVQTIRQMMAEARKE